MGKGFTDWLFFLLTEIPYGEISTKAMSSLCQGYNKAMVRKINDSLYLALI